MGSSSCLRDWTRETGSAEAGSAGSSGWTAGGDGGLRRSPVSVGVECIRLFQRRFRHRPRGGSSFPIVRGRKKKGRTPTANRTAMGTRRFFAPGGERCDPQHPPQIHADRMGRSQGRMICFWSAPENSGLMLETRSFRGPQWYPRSQNRDLGHPGCWFSFWVELGQQTEFGDSARRPGEHFAIDHQGRHEFVSIAKVITTIGCRLLLYSS